MVFDLFILTAIGFVLEIFAVKFSGAVFKCAPSAAISLLIVFVAVVRWNWWGLLSVPFMALGVYLGGVNMDYFDYLRAVYDWRMYLSSAAGLSMIGLNSIFFIKFKTKKIINNMGLLLIMMAVDYILVCGVQMLIYGVSTIGAGDMVYYSTMDNEYHDLRLIGEFGVAYNTFGLVVLGVGAFVLRSQGVLCNAKARILEDKKNAELDREFNKFTIDEGDCSIKEEKDNLQVGTEEVGEASEPKTDEAE